jgi:hypothetical protein
MLVSQKYRLDLAIKYMEEKRENSGPRETKKIDRVLYFLKYLKQLKI